MNSSPFDLKLFGSPSIEGVGGENLLTGRAAQRHRVALLALIAMAPAQRLSRDKLIAYLWPESDTERGRNLLRVSTYVLRSTFGESALITEGEDLRLNADVVRVDTAEFESALERGDYARAVALYRSPFLDGFFLSDAEDFEQWVDRARARLADGYGKALEALADESEAKQDFSRATEWWKLRAAHDPYDSRIAVRLLRALEASGNRAGALQHAAVHQRLLQDELGMPAAPEIVALAERLRREPGEPMPDPPALVRREPPSSREAVTILGVGNAANQATQSSSAAPINRRRVRGWTAAMAVVAIALVVTTVWNTRSGVAQRDGSIAVLPFVNLSRDGDNEYFSDGLTEEIITGLSGVPALKVISRTSAMYYKGSKTPLRQIAQELAVSHVLEGSVRQNGGRVRITAQLIDARNDEHLWAQNYDSDLGDVVRVQEQIAREVVRALELELGDRGRTALVRQGTSNPEAYQFYRRARYLWNTRSPDGHDQAIDYFQRAIALDSSYADAYAGIADASFTAWQLNIATVPEAETYSRTKWAVERALALDDKSSDAHTSSATVFLWQKNWPGAEREFRRAIQLNPSHATAHSWYSLLLAGRAEGSSEEALKESRRAYELDPFAAVMGNNYAWQYYLARDYDRAIELYHKTLEIGPNWGRLYERLALAYALKGNLDEAHRLMRKAIELDPQRADFVADVAYVQALRGETAAALETLRQAKSQPLEPFHIARAYVALKQPDSAFAWLERSTWQWPNRAVRSEPALDPLRGDPRFAQLSARVERAMGLK